MKNKKRIYDRQKLLDLVNKEHSCIILKRCNRKIELPAKYLKDVKSGIKEALDSGLNKFDYSLNGILLDYQNLSVLVDGWSGRIVGRFGEFLVTVTADFFIFDPKIGSLLEGVVNVKSSTHVGCLVHKIFNAMILKPDVEDKWNCENIQIGDKIIFTIVDHVFSTNIPHIEGVLATEYIEKSSKNTKKKLKLSASQSQGLTENGKFDDLGVIVEANKKISKPDEVDSSISSVRKEEIDLAGILGNKSPKPKSKKRRIDPMDAITDNMDVEESIFHVKKKKKSKSKEKNETILETEKPLEPFSESSKPIENPASVFSKLVIPTTESECVQIKPKKKKRDKVKELDGSESTTEHKKKKKKDKKKDFECDVVASLETVEKKKYYEDMVVEKSVPKSKKKKKREKEKSCLDVEETGEQCELPSSQKNMLCIDDNTEFNVNPVDLIDQLMNVVPTDIILPSETTPVKGTSLEKHKSPKLGDVRKNETPEKSRSPNKKKREGSVTDITSKSTVADVQVSQAKKRHSGELLKSPKPVKLLDKSLFSDSEESAQSPMKTLPKPVVVDFGSSQWKVGGTKDEDDESPITSTQIISKKPNDNKKEEKPKKVKDPLNPGENKSKEKAVAIKEGGDSISSIIKSPSNKKDKKESGNKSVTWESENVVSRGAESKTTLLQRFERCLGDEEVKLINDLLEKSKTTPVKKDVNQTECSPTKKKSIDESSAAKESNKNAEPEKGTDKSDNNLGQSLTEKMSYSKRFSFDIGHMQLNNPVKTSTPKTASNKSDNPGGNVKIKKPRSKKDKKTSGKDERASIINALLAQARASLGISELF